MGLITEAVVASMLASIGAFTLALLRPDLGRVPVAAFGGLAGTLMLTIPSGAAVLLGRAMSVVWLLPLLAIVGALMWVRRSDLGGPLRGAALAAITVFVAAIAIGVVSAPILTFDSWRFLEYGSSLYGDGHPVETLQQLFANYPLLLTSLEGFVRSLGLPFASTGLSALGVVAIAGAADIIVRRRRMSRTLALALMVAAVVAVASSSYLLRVQLGYVNSHVLAAGFLSVAVASVFASAVSLGDASEVSEKTRAWLVAGACSGLALSRVEGMLFIGLVLAVAIGARHWSRSSLFILGVGVAVPAVWYLGLAASGASGDILSPSRVVILTGVAVAPFALRLILGSRASLEWIPALGLIALGLAAVLLVLTRSEGFSEAARAMTLNLAVDGLWGAVWWVLFPLAAFALVALRKDFSAWFLITFGYLIVVVMLGAIREFPYRVGWGDSGNRMMIHVAPVFVLLALFAFSSAEDGQSLSSRWRKAEQGPSVALE